tara:strand:+ start:151 stop:474 length:324 start_codon:yes stop_codon:yes gene_type:complete
MKKITMSVAALAIAISSYGQCNHGDDWNYQQEVKTFKSIEYQLADLIDAIRMDMYYGHLERQRGEFYIKEVMKVNNRNKELMASIWKDRMVTLGEHQNNIDNNLGNE